jgi:hypothetical protein
VPAHPCPGSASFFAAATEKMPTEMSRAQTEACAARLLLRTNPCSHRLPLPLAGQAALPGHVYRPGAFVYVLVSRRPALVFLSRTFCIMWCGEEPHRLKRVCKCQGIDDWTPNFGPAKGQAPADGDASGETGGVQQAITCHVSRPYAGDASLMEACLSGKPQFRACPKVTLSS